MLHRYAKSDAPAWQRRLVLLLWALFSATLLLLAAWAVVLLVDQARIDDCLELGGHFDHDRGECDIR